MVCSQCGQTVPDGAAFCSNCGQTSGFQKAGFPELFSHAGAPGAIAAEKTSGLAIASLVFGMLFLFFPLSIVAVVLGHVSLSQIKKSAGRLGGRGLAIAGLILGYLGIAVIPLILIIAAIAIPNLMRARIAANEAYAAQSIRAINTAQARYQVTYGSIGYAPDLLSLGGAQPCTASSATACLIDNQLARATTPSGRNGYVFAVARSADGSQYVASAVPVQRNQTGRRSFCSTEDGIVRVDPNGDPIPNSDVCVLLSPVH
jgi:type IV pilus assembly protein PilA